MILNPYPAIIKQKMWLYKDGFINNLTGGFTINDILPVNADGWATSTIEDSYMKIYSSTGRIQDAGAFSTANQIKVNGYKTLNVKFSYLYRADASMEINVGCCLNDTEKKMSGPTSTWNGSTLPFIYSCDISDANGYYYIVAMALNYNDINSTFEARISEIWLE